MGEIHTDIGSHEQQQSAFLGALSATNGTCNAWMVTLKMSGRMVQFKLDTGAEVSAISDTTFRSFKGHRLIQPSKSLYGPACSALEVIGQFDGRLSHGRKSTTQTMFVVKGLRNNFLCLPAIVALNLVAQVDTTTTASSNTVDKFPDLFQGLGNLGEPYDIQLQPDAKPYSLFTPVISHYPYVHRLKQNWTEWKQELSPKWTYPLLGVQGWWLAPKKNGSIRICIDFKPLNAYIIREVHPLPTVDENLAQLSGAKMFSKLDANSGFWQIPLSENSKLLTTFVTPYGRYYFHKLPFTYLLDKGTAHNGIMPGWP